MMIEKLITIKNVTKFRDFNYTGDIEFRTLNLIYAENGKGKSSIAAIFRSLSTGDPSPILAKQTIGSTDVPHIQIKHQGGIAEFKNQAWTNTLPNLLIFDSFYVTSNIFSGDYVSHEHKKNLYYLLIGEKSVQLAKRIEDLDVEIRELGRQIPDAEKDIRRAVIGVIDTKVFLELEALPDIDDQISKQVALIESLVRSREIQSTPALSPIVIPVIDKNQLVALLAATMESVSRDVEQKFKHHCNTLGPNSETWIRNGVEDFQNIGDKCPFCGQAVTTSDLVGLYGQYFSQEYSRLKSSIQDYKQSLENTLSTEVLLNIQRQASDNFTRASFWKTYIQENYPETNFDQLKNATEGVLREAKKLLDQKYNAPLEIIAATDEFNTSLHEYNNVIEAIGTQNTAVESINLKIEQKKGDVILQSLDDAQTRLNLLQNIKIRHEPFMKEICDKYISLNGQKEILTQDKSTARDQLDAETEDVIGKCQVLLNTLLGNFGADFQIHKAQTSMLGGKPSVSYSLLINGESIPLGSDETFDKPGFKTTLSDGEKNSLAFAFFLAQVFQDPELSNKIVVIDDPITSLDEQRRMCTKQEIVKVANAAKQVIVLSHDPIFLKGISEDFQNPKSLIIKRVEQGSTIEEWDIDSATQTQYQKDYLKIRKYIDRAEGDRREVARCIRPLLEGYLRVRFPEEFAPREWLGGFIKKIREIDDAEPLATMKRNLEELSNINDFSKRFHHDTDPNFSANRDNVTDAELQTWAKRTIEFIRTS